MKKLTAFTTSLLLLSGCWSVTQDKLSVRFSRINGSGSFTRTLGSFTCEEKGQSCAEKNYSDLEKMKARYEKYLGMLGSSSVKAKLKKLDGEVTGKFSSLTQLPFFKEMRSSHQDQPGNRTDLVLEFLLDEKGDFKAKEFSFEFTSTDEEAVIEEVSPLGILDATRHTVTWTSLPAFSGVATLKIRLRGKGLPE